MCAENVVALDPTFLGAYGVLLFSFAIAVVVLKSS